MSKVSTKEAIKLIQQGEVVALPTETVYGLAADINNSDALKKVFTVKERPFFDPLIVHVCSIEMAKSLCSKWSSVAQDLAEAFWPGPLTLVLPKSDLVSPIITAGLPSVGLRMPNHPLFLEIISQTQTPLAAPSANKFKRTSPTIADHVLDEFNNIVPVVDGEQCLIGIESTVVGVFDHEIHVYRQGQITTQDISDLTKLPVIIKENPAAPGQLKEHYRPHHRLTVQLRGKLDMQSLENCWSLPDDPRLVARQLYDKIRQMDHSPITFIVDKKWCSDIRWAGILERLEKAATTNYLNNH